MKLRRIATTVATLALVPAALVALSAGPAIAGSTYQYTIHQHQETDTFTDTGLCDPGPALLELSSINTVLHVAATTPDLTEEQVLALLEGGEGLVRVTFTQTGSFRVTEADGQVYTGRFTIWFGGNDNRSTDAFTFTFSATGESADGRHIRSHSVAHGTFKDGEPVVEFEKNDTKGC